MNLIVYTALSTIFNNTLADNISDFVSNIVNALANIFQNNTVSTYFSLFTGAAAALLTIFFMINMLSDASKDMISFERLVLAFIKLFLGVTILIYLPNILEGLFNAVRYIYAAVASVDMNEVSSGLGITFNFDGNPTNTFPEPFNEDMKFITGRNFIKGIAANFLAIMVGMLVGVIRLFVIGGSYLFVMTNATSLIVRAIFAPIAVAQFFEDGQRNNAMKYLKKFAADGLALAVMAGVLYAASVLQSNIMASILADVIQGEELTAQMALGILTNLEALASLLIINFGAIGAIMKSNQIAQDIVGV